MIRINLLPVKAKQRQVTVVTQLAVGGIIVVALAAVMGAHYLWLKGDENRLIADNTQLTAEIDNLQRLIGEVEKLESKEKELNTKLETIAQLKRNKIGPVYMLEELSVVTPRKLWFKSIQETTIDAFHHNIVIDGEATTNETIAEFMTKLEESKLFTNVQLVRTTFHPGKAMDKQVFQIKAELIFDDAGS